LNGTISKYNKFKKKIALLNIIQMLILIINKNTYSDGKDKGPNINSNIINYYNGNSYINDILYPNLREHTKLNLL